CCTEGEMAADAESDDADFSSRDFRMFGEPIQARTAIGIEVGDRSLRGVLLAAGASGVVEGDHRAWWFDAAIDFRCGGDESVAGEPHAGAKHWRTELEDVRVAPDAGILALGFRRSDEGSHRGTRQRNVGVFGGDDHLIVRERLWRR